jgi:hypothetical protein
VVYLASEGDSLFKFQYVNKAVNNSGAFGGVYFLAFIGAAIYYIQQADSFWGWIVGLFKAAVWPAFIMYEVLKLLQL